MPVITEQRGQVLIVTMDREAKRNAIDRELSLGLEAALDRIEDDPAIRVGVLTGTKTIFSAGSDLREGGDAHTERGGEYGMIRRRRSKPLIAAVEGRALGGGFEIAMSCDLVVAAMNAGFGLPEALRGVVPTSGALFRAARALPLNVATRLMLTGEDLSAERAYALGFVSELAEPGEAVERAVELGALICRSAPTSIAQILKAQQDLVAEEDARGWATTAAAAKVVVASEDREEGLAAFFGRRPPTWPGR